MAPDAVSASVVAHKFKHRVEVAAARSETSRTFANPNGSFGREQSLVPVRTKRANGSWAAIDTSLKRASDGSLVPGAVIGGVRLSGGGTGPLATLTDRSAGKELSVSWKLGALPKPTIDGDTAVYADVLTGVDLLVRVAPDGFSHLLVVKDRAAAANPALRQIEFPVSTRGVTVKAGPDSRISVVDSVGKSVFSAPKPMMWDSSGPEGDDVRERAGGPGAARNRAAMATSVTATAVTVTPDVPLLKRRDTKYPVFIDPSWRVDNSIPGATSWTHVDWAHPDQDYSSHWDTGSNAYTMPVGPYSDSSGTGLSRSFVRFDTGWAAGKTITVARLQLTVVSGYVDCRTWREIQVYDSGWAGGATTWNTQPGIGTQRPSISVKAPSCGEGTGKESDVTGAVQYAAANNVGAWAFALKAPAAAEENWYTSYRYKFENTATLYVEYNSIPGVPTDLSNENKACSTTLDGAPYLPTRRPTLRAKITDPDGGLLSANFIVDRWDGAAKQWAEYPGASGRQDNVASGGVAQWTPPLDLPDGWYSWRVTATDWINTTDVNAWCYLVVDGTPPAPAKAVTSTDYPNDGELHGSVGRTGAFTITPASGDVASYVVTVNDNQPTKGREFPAASDGSAVVQVTPTQEATNFLYVWARDKAGNLAEATKPYVYQFKAGSASANIAHWTMNETSGSTVTDRIGGRIAALSGGASLDRGVLHFNGTTGRASTTGPVVATTGSFTVSAWVRVADDTRTQTILGQGTGATDDTFQIQFVRDGDQRKFEARLRRVNGATVCTIGSAVVGEWVHLLFSFDAGSMMLVSARNGKGFCGGEVSSPLVSVPASLHLGSDGSWAGYFAGDVDDVRVWDRVVYEREFAAIVAAGDGPVLRWKLDEGTGTTAADASGKGNTGTVTGGATWVEGHTGSPDQAVHIGDTGSVDAAGPVVRTDRSFTVSAWARLDNANQQMQTVVSQDGVNNGVFRLGYSNLDRWVFAVYGKDVVSDSTAYAGVDQRPAVGTWTHLVGVYDAAAGQIRLYVNGTPAGTASVAPLWNATGPLHAGRMIGVGGSPYRFSGDIDDVRVYSGVLSADDIALLAAG